MKSNQILTVICLWTLNSVAIASAQQNPDSIFEHYFRNAQAFADTYPQEKAYLHFDNTSYYIGDTIWFKAYVTLTEGNLPSNISKPLYVEILDQLGNVTERQIIKLKEGEGHGQIIIKPFYLPGYYEIRAYTRWMQAFEEKQYFSRTFPIYRRTQKNGVTGRSIGTYRLDESMKQRPHQKEKKFSLRFFPEGGAMVQGITSLIAFEAEDREYGPAQIEGTLKDKEGNIITRFRAWHEGMGYFAYRPEEKEAIAEVEYEGKIYRFPLPEALPQGCVLHVEKQRENLNIQITRNFITQKDTLALFISRQGRPLMYKKVDFSEAQIMCFNIPAKKLPEGVIQISLITAKGETLCERLYYMMPDTDTNLRIKTSSSAKTMYKPYAPIQCQLSVEDRNGSPVSTRLSVAIRDALASDYMEYDHNIYTDQLLTSDLKGYIHQPGYYFASRSPQRQRELNALMLVRGWRKYDMERAIGTKVFHPSYMPEERLILHGQIRSYVRQKEKKDMGVTVMIKKDTLSMMGVTITDSLGYFDIPVEELEGDMDALIQTRRKNKKYNKLTTIRLLRNFSPPQRKYGYQEMNPTYIDMDSLRTISSLADSLYEDSIMKQADSYTLGEVQVKAKRHRKNMISKFEQNIKAFYDVSVLLDELRDKGNNVEDLPTLLKLLNENIIVKRKEGMSIMTYNFSNFDYLVNGVLTTPGKVQMYISDDIDAIKYIILGDGRMALDAMDITGYQSVNQDYESVFETFFDHSPDYTNDKGIEEEIRVDSLGRVSYFPNKTCYIVTIDDWQKDKRYGGAWGIRRTRIQSYSKPIEFYSPAYTDKNYLPENNHRRTLYWNPNLETDENGKAVINCYNTNSSTFLTISAETLWKGKPAALTK